MWVSDDREAAETLRVNCVVLLLDMLNEELAKIDTKRHETPLHLPGLPDGNGSPALLLGLLQTLQIAHTDYMIKRLDFTLALAGVLE